jgi:hypothetical protein
MMSHGSNCQFCRKDETHLFNVILSIEQMTKKMTAVSRDSGPAGRDLSAAPAVADNRRRQ